MDRSSSVCAWVGGAGGAGGLALDEEEAVVGMPPSGLGTLYPAAADPPPAAAIATAGGERTPAAVVVDDVARGSYDDVL
jgi:hypothetical protein